MKRWLRRLAVFGIVLALLVTGIGIWALPSERVEWLDTPEGRFKVTTSRKVQVLPWKEWTLYDSSECNGVRWTCIGCLLVVKSKTVE